MSEHKLRLGWLALVALGLLPGSGWAAPITQVVAQVDQRYKWDNSNGDTWDPFWADDGNLYAFNCDGRGFGHKNRNFAFNEFTGLDLGHLVGQSINTMDAYGSADEKKGDGGTWKVCGQECIDGVFYAFAVRNVYGKDSHDPQMRQTSFNASLIKSTDHGLTWTRSEEENYNKPMWPGSRFGAPGFIHFGQNGGHYTQDQADRYVYAISNNGFWNGGDDFILGRVDRNDLPRLQASDWTYWSGGDGANAASWSPDLAKAAPILSRPAKCGWTAPTYIPALNCYLLVSWYVTPPLKHWFAPDKVVYDFYQAGHPWGPWTPVGSLDDRFLPPGHHMYGPNLCAKYQEQGPDGNVRIALFTSGCPFEDKPTGYYKAWMIPLLLKTEP